MLRAALPLSWEGVSSPQQQGGTGDQAALLQAPGIVCVHPPRKGAEDFIRAGVSTPRKEQHNLSYAQDPPRFCCDALANPVAVT